MNSFNCAVKLLVVGLAVAIFATGCATAKPKKAPAAPPKAAADDSYTVVSGDCLWCISGKSQIYGDPYQWPLIYRANKDQIKDADLIYPGQNLNIDRNASSALKAASDKHARNRGAWSLGVVEESDKAFLSGNP